MSFQGNNPGPLTYKFTAAVASNLLVTLSGTAGAVVVCGASGYAIGAADGDVAAGAYGNCMPLRQRIRLICSGAINAGDYVKAAAAGQVAPEAAPATRTAATIGQAETATTAQGDAVYVVCV